MIIQENKSLNIFIICEINQYGILHNYVTLQHKMSRIVPDPVLRYSQLNTQKVLLIKFWFLPESDTSGISTHYVKRNKFNSVEKHEKNGITIL